MHQMTLRRTCGSELFAPPIVIAAAAHADEIERQIGSEVGTLVLEPSARSTARAAAAGAEPASQGSPVRAPRIGR
jgi:mannose-1-phosphate guanylyltransferase/mannose-1-phosphate guanylyltransferase/mannose-6-phosphate isomerase